MKTFKRIGVCLVAVFMAVIFSFVFVGCDKSNKDNSTLSFECVSQILDNFNEKQKPFLATLEFKYKNTEDESRVKTISNSIYTLTKGMSESMKAFQTVYNEYINSVDESITISVNQEQISIKFEETEYLAKLNINKTDLYIYTKDGGNECVYEIRAKIDGGYLLQIISRNSSDSTFTIYQMSFNDTKGKLSIDEHANSFTSFYSAELNEEFFPYVSQYVFSN